MKIFRVVWAAVLSLFLLSVVVNSQTAGTVSTASNPSYGVYYNGEVYFIAQGAGELQVIKGDQIVSTVKLPGYPNPFRLAVLNGSIYVVYQDGPLIELNGDGQVVWNYTVPEVGKYPAIISAGGYIVVTASNGDEVYFITLSHQVRSVTVMPYPQALAYDNYTDVVYVGGYGGDSIYGISLSDFKVVQNITLNVSSVEAMAFVPPDLLAVAPGHHHFEVVNLTDGKVVAFVSLPYTIGAINGYAWMCYIPYDHYIALSVPHDSDTVVIFNAEGNVVEEVTVGNSPNGIVYDPQDHYIYVMDYGSSTVSYFPAPPPQETTKTLKAPDYTPFVIATVAAVVVLAAIGAFLFTRRGK